MVHAGSVRRKAGLAAGGRGADFLDLTRKSLGQSCPQRCPPLPGSADTLGTPLSITKAARFIGCSPWTVRQKLIPLGLPVFRSGAGGKLIFYTNQVARWIERHQGGTT
jgi:hypothetical protein